MDAATAPASHLACIPAKAGDGAEPRIQHPGWCEAQDRILAGLVAGPAFIALLGPAGTGKTWLLQAVLAALQARDQAVVLVRSGELPIEAATGTILIDEAARMDDAKLAQLACIRTASVVLADLPDFEARFEPLADPPDIIVLAPLPDRDVPGFTRAWLDLHGLPADVLDAPALARLAEHSGGMPRLVAQLLRAALAMAGPAATGGIGADEVDEVASLRLGGLRDEEAGTIPALPVLHQNLGPVQISVPVQASGAPAPVAVPETPACVLVPDAPAQDVPALVPILAPASLPVAVPARRWRRLRRAGQAAAWPAMAASLLAVVVVAALQGRHPSGRGEAPAAVVQAGPTLGSDPEAGPSSGAGQVQPHLEAHASVGGTVAVQGNAGWDVAAVLEPAATPAVPAVDPVPVSVAPAALADPAGAFALEPQADAFADSPPPLAAAPADPALAMPEPAVAALSVQEATHPSAPEPAVLAAAVSPAAAMPLAPIAELPPAPDLAAPAAPADVAAAAPPAAMQGDASASPPALMASQADPALPAPLSQPLPSPMPSALSAAPDAAPLPARREGQPGAPGLVFVAQAGDTMPVLYARVYRGVRPPPYPDVVAANTMPIRPGALVVFPTPPDGWARR